MRAYQVFAAMPSDTAARLLRAIGERSPQAFARTLEAASHALRVRPVYLRRLPFERRAETIRRALARVASNELAEELLALYFLECRKELLIEWLEAVGLEHEDGVLRADLPPSPAPEVLRQAVERFRSAGSGQEGAERELLLRAFAAQSAIDWPALEELLGNEATERSKGAPQEQEA